jgi:exopolysaccharide production protein ExoY
MPGWKRSLDLMVVFLTLPLWLGLMIVIAFWIRIVSPGPVFFQQRRIGFRGKHFSLFKFRSMGVCTGTRSHEDHFDRLVEANRPMTKLDVLGDPRLIRGARFLRATGLDELPQILNVIKGEMSLVGPRPCTPRELPKFAGPPLERFNTPPGLTGYWQVNGKNSTTFSEMLDLDICYVRNASLRLDLLILLKTPAALWEQLDGASQGPTVSSEVPERFPSEVSNNTNY